VNTFPAHPKLDEHELLLAQMQFADFRSANLFGMLTHQVRPGTVAGSNRSDTAEIA